MKFISLWNRITIIHSSIPFSYDFEEFLLSNMDGSIVQSKYFEVDFTNLRIRILTYIVFNYAHHEILLSSANGLVQISRNNGQQMLFDIVV